MRTEGSKADVTVAKDLERGLCYLRANNSAAGQWLWVMVWPIIRRAGDGAYVIEAESYHKTVGALEEGGFSVDYDDIVREASNG
jgi:hypothetical protein